MCLNMSKGFYIDFTSNKDVEFQMKKAKMRIKKYTPKKQLFIINKAELLILLKQSFAYLSKKKRKKI